ncbi:MAG TPA: hypothetical protein VGK32_23465 [Vicinamibacterales bacterium]|jgi:hypothetical protein
MKTISEITRRAIADGLAEGPYDWAGRFNEIDFLSRLYDLTALPSDDGRYETAAGDIRQHRVNNQDGEPDWVFYDHRFELLRGTDEAFVQFLSGTVHPAVRPHSDQAWQLVEMYNGELRRDGWELVQTDEISGRPVFSARRADAQPEVFEEPTGWPKVDRQVDEIRLRLREGQTEEQFQAVGHMCRETLISLAQAVYNRNRHPPLDGSEPSATDAKRMLEAFIAAELAGPANADARKHARAAFDLANGLQHDRTAGFRDAALCAEATVSVVRIAAIVSGRRERTELGD